jgi:hypothetical protein
MEILRYLAYISVEEMDAPGAHGDGHQLPLKPLGHRPSYAPIQVFKKLVVSVIVSLLGRDY